MTTADKLRMAIGFVILSMVIFATGYRVAQSSYTPSMKLQADVVKCSKAGGWAYIADLSFAPEVYCDGQDGLSWPGKINSQRVEEMTCQGTSQLLVEPPAYLSDDDKSRTFHFRCLDKIVTPERSQR